MKQNNSLRIVDFMFNDHIFESTKEYEFWKPDSLDQIDEWVQVLVGTEANNGHWFQIHICTHKAISDIKDKKNLFPISYWVSVDDLISKLDKFIDDVVPKDLNLENETQYSIAMETLSKYWFWEYGGYR